MPARHRSDHKLLDPVDTLLAPRPRSAQSRVQRAAARPVRRLPRRAGILTLEGVGLAREVSNAARRHIRSLRGTGDRVFPDRKQVQRPSTGGYDRRAGTGDGTCASEGGQFADLASGDWPRRNAATPCMSPGPVGRR